MASPTIVDGIDISAIRLFLSVIELGSVSKAAERHVLAQPSATAKLQKLERQLGVAILERSPTGSKPTAAGIGLAPACAEVLTTASELVERADALRNEATRLAVATTRHVAEHRLPEWIIAAGLHDIRLDLVETNTLGVAQEVRNRGVAIGFIEGPFPPIGLSSEVVATEELVPVVGSSHPWSNRRRAITPADLMKTTMVLPRPGSGTRDVVEAALHDQPRTPESNHFEVSTGSAARLAAINGAGIAFLPFSRVEDDLAAGRLHLVEVKDTTIMQPVRAIWRGARPSIKAAARLLDAVLAARAPGLLG